MIRDRKVLALIPARGGSKGIKNKNIIELCGNPLISYTINAAKKSSYVDNVIVSTDSQEIANIAQMYGADIPFIRPVKYAGDKSKTIETVIHAIEWLKNHDISYDILILLQPTSPLRDSTDIDNALEVFEHNGENALVSVCKVNDNPTLIRSVGKDGKLVNLLNRLSTVRRQDMQEYYRVNGAIYINVINEIAADTSFNDNPIPYFMNRKHSVDIDDENDLQIAAVYLESSTNLP